MNKGTFIVIDGTDGSGKKTQIDLLEKALLAQNIPVKKVDFPRYGEYSAVFVEKYLNGYFGTAEEVSAKQASLFYALDRYAASFEMKQWLREGYVLISNRYTSANIGHQGGKISDTQAREAYITWLMELEYDILQIPRPDLTLFLHVPHHIGMELVKEKTIQREYIEKQDIHETDKAHMEQAEASYLFAAQTYPGWKQISCCSDTGTLYSREEIQEAIWKEIAHLLPIQA